MTVATASAIESSIEKTNIWLNDLAIRLETDRDGAYTAMRAVLHSLRDRLTIGEAFDLASQLPMIVRGFYWEGYNPSLAPNRERTTHQFLESVAESLNTDAIDTRSACEATFATLQEHIDAGTCQHVFDMLPEGVRDDLWVTA